MSDSAAGELALTEAILHDVLILRYISAAGLTILLYDHLLSFADEVQLIWSAKLTSSKVLFLAMRYLVPGMMIAETIQLAGLSNVSLSNEFCKAWLTFAVLVGWVTIAINNWFVLLRVWVLWDRNRIFIISTLLFFIAMHATTLALAWIGVAHMINTLYFVPLFQLCGFSAFSDIGVVWIPELLFEFLMLMAMGWKVRMRPKTLKSLQEEGFGYFLFLFGLTLANTVVFLAARVRTLLGRISKPAYSFVFGHRSR
ncbi:hypothetical protein B0H17DRAFT_1037453 [Mycena rosella]|uniref:DUF6533 domain-containing protein n=1 Tax=Mycena rosella TaxID=1033263 RepID=A0AAD7M830_MYCRO|nr:hypothetical protein B0H17DRAFT_1037453 [Mycena rosella]